MDEMRWDGNNEKDKKFISFTDNMCKKYFNYKIYL